MNAWMLNDVGDIRLESIDVPTPNNGEVLINVKAAGICGSDIPRIYDTGAHNMPLVPGHEFAGIVDSVASNVSSNWIGKRVAIYPKIACGKCYECLNGNSNMCEDYDYVGSRRNGAFAEYVAVPANNLIVMPDGVSFEEAAMLEPLAVSANAVRRVIDSDISKEAPVAVCGLGTIGLMTIMLLNEAGYNNIYAIGNKPSQLEKVLRLGVDEDRFCDSSLEDVSSWVSSNVPGGFKAYFECVGKNESISYGLQSCSSFGLIILVGNPYSDMYFSRDTYWKILRKQLQLCGVWNSTFESRAKDDERLDDWNYVLRKIKDGTIRPADLISHRFDINELDEGFKIMKNKTEDYCKVMMVDAV